MWLQLLFLCRSHLFIAVIPLLSEQVRRRVSDAGGKRPHWSRPFGFGVGECFIFDLAFHVSRNGRAYGRESIVASRPSAISRTSSRKVLAGFQPSFLESYPGNRTAVLVPPADQTPDHASRVSAMEVNYMKDASNKFGHVPNGAHIYCVPPSALCGRRVSRGILQSLSKSD